VAEVKFVSEDQALVQARRELVEFKDAYRDLQVNPLPASLEIRLKDGFRDAAHVAQVADRVRGFPFVEDVRYGRDWIARLDQLRNMSGVVGLIIGAAFALIAVVIIGVTIRLTIMQRAREIAIMRVVGATNWFVRGPFLLEGALKGSWAGCWPWRSRSPRTRCSAGRDRCRRSCSSVRSTWCCCWCSGCCSGCWGAC
jgi:cell division transport system permease protein